MPSDGQADAGSQLARIRIASLLIELEYRLQFIRVYAIPTIADGNDKLLFPSVNLDLDAFSLIGKFDGIIEQIIKDLCQAIAIDYRP